MISKKDLQGLIKSIRMTTGKNQEQVSIGAGYKAKTLTQILSKNEGLDAVYDHLKLVYKAELNNSTLKPDPDINANLREISKALTRIENGQVYIRAEVRGYGQYQIMEKVQWDQKKFLQAMDKVGKLVGANLAADDLRGNENEGN